MMGFQRSPTPELLETHGHQWTTRWEERRQANPSAGFDWPQVDGRPVNQILLSLLGEMTLEHCSYCDGFPINATGQPTIDHFRPKHRFLGLAFAWENLFYACDRCQGRNGKGEQWSDPLLKPDESDYSFFRYFRYVNATGRLEPNPEASTEDQRRATETIRIFRLNDDGRTADRKRVLRLYRSFAPENCPYRFLFSPLE